MFNFYVFNYDFVMPMITFAILEFIMFYIILPMTALIVVVFGSALYLSLKQIKKTGFWYLYLDDERELPKHYNLEKRWFVCRSTEEAKSMVMKYGIPCFMSLDHDLGGEDTSMKFLHWLAEEYFTNEVKNKNGNSLVIPTYVIHSQNPIGAENVKSYMESWKKAYNSND